MSDESVLTEPVRAELTRLLSRARDGNQARNHALTAFRDGSGPTSEIERYQRDIDGALSDAKAVLTRCSASEEAGAIVTEIEHLAHGGNF